MNEYIAYLGQVAYIDTLPSCHYLQPTEEAIENLDRLTTTRDRPFTEITNFVSV